MRVEWRSGPPATGFLTVEVEVIVQMCVLASNVPYQDTVPLEVVVTFGLALVDLTTGDFLTTELESTAALLAELERLRPAEIIFPTEATGLRDLLRGAFQIMSGYDDWTFAPETAFFTVREQFKVATLDGFNSREILTEETNRSGEAARFEAGQCPLIFGRKLINDAAAFQSRWQCLPGVSFHFEVIAEARMRRE